MVGDPALVIAKLYDMLPADVGTTSDGRNAAANAPVRTVFVIGPDKRVELTMSYPMTTGRNFAEILRTIDSMRLTAKCRVATPARKRGEGVIVTSGVSNAEAEVEVMPGHRAMKPYLRMVDQPKSRRTGVRSAFDVGDAGHERRTFDGVDRA